MSDFISSLPNMESDENLNTAPLQTEARSCYRVTEGQGDGDIDWKQSYYSLASEFDQFKQDSYNQTQEKLAAMESRLMSMNEEASKLKHSLEKDNRRLTRLNDSAEYKNSVLEKEMHDTRSMFETQLRHAHNLKDLLDAKCSDLEQKLAAKERLLTKQHIALEDHHNRVSRLTLELRNQDIENEGLRKAALSLKQQYDDDLEAVVEKYDAAAIELKESHHNTLKCAHENFKEIEKRLADRTMLVRKALDDDERAGIYDPYTRTVLERNIDKTITHAHRTVKKVQKSARLTLAQNHAVQQDMNRVARALELLADDLNSFHLDSEKMREEVYKVLDVDKTSIKLLPEATPTLERNETYSAFKILETMPVSELGCDILEVMQKERRSIYKFVSSLLKWSSTVSAQRQRYNEQINHLEDNINLEKMKYIRDTDNARQQLVVYKRLALNLRKKLEKELNVKSSLNIPAGFVPKRVPSGAGPRIPNKLAAISATDKVKKRFSMTKQAAKLSCCSEFKYMLETSENVLKKLDESRCAFQIMKQRYSKKAEAEEVETPGPDTKLRAPKSKTTMPESELQAPKTKAQASKTKVQKPKAGVHCGGGVQE